MSHICSVALAKPCTVAVAAVNQFRRRSPSSAIVVEPKWPRCLISASDRPLKRRLWKFDSICALISTENCSRAPQSNDDTSLSLFFRPAGNAGDADAGKRIWEVGRPTVSAALGESQAGRGLCHGACAVSSKGRRGRPAFARQLSTHPCLRPIRREEELPAGLGPEAQTGP
jgi:hypothetical protein